VRRMGLFDEALGKFTPVLDAKFGELIQEIRVVNANINKLRQEMKEGGLLK